MWDIKEQLVTLLLALRDKCTPTLGKVFAILSIVYLLSPVDVVFDGIPFAGILDDLILVPFGLWLSRQQIPKEVLDAAREEAKKYSGILNKIAIGLLAFVFIWLLIAVGLIYLLIRALF
jgi:uncharacterized membrane protein YkvA (DUF1232 family)